MRELCLFSAHNLVNDPPFSQIDLISCRNVLIYLGNHLQQKLIPIFHYSLRSNGFLFLGNSESITGHAELFKTISAKDRIAQKKTTSIRAYAGQPTSFQSSYSFPSPAHLNLKDADIHLIGQRILLDEFSPRYAIITDDMDILSLSEGMDQYLTHPVGVFEPKLPKLIRPELRVALRSTFREAQKEKRKFQHAGSTFRKGDEVSRVRLTVQPMPQLGNETGLYMVVFTDLGMVSDTELEQSAQPEKAIEFSVVEQLEKELADVKSDLDRTVQDLEASNEELKSSNEELLSMNEELQSANEELESSKEEVQAANDNLHRTNTDLENLLSSTQIATLFLSDDLEIKSFTPAVSLIYKILPRDIGRHITDLAHRAAHMPIFPESSRMLVAGQDAEIVMPDGRVFLRRILPYRTEGNQRDGLVITFTDVTELRRSEGLFQAIANAAPALTWVTDQQGVARYFNPQWILYTGRSAVESVNMGWLQVVSEEQREGFGKRVLEGFATNLAFEEDLLLTDANGEVRWHTVQVVPARTGHGSIAAWVFSAFDVNSIRVRHNELAASELYFRQLCTFIPQMIWRANDKGVVNFYSKQWLDFIGQSLEVALATGMDMLHADDRQNCETKWKHAVEHGSTFECEYRILGADGQYRWFLARAEPFEAPDGSQEWVGTATDLNNFKLETSQLEQQKLSADISNKLKSAFLANMSHEIRTPLGAIIGFSEILRDYVVSNPDALDYNERILRNALHLGKLVDEILDLSKIEADRMEIEKIDFDPQEILRDIFSIVDLKAREKSLRLHQNWLTPVPREIHTDPTRFRQVLLNVLGNAVKFTLRGSIELEMSVIQSADARRMLQIDVIDTGIGISKENQRKLFAPFSQADAGIARKFGGSGLGLNLSAKLLQAMGGSLHLLQSQEGSGSAFRILLEIGADRSIPVTSVPPAGEQPLASIKGTRVLVVDDSNDNLMIAVRFLAKEGAIIVTAKDGLEAVERARESERDIIFMDLQMPGMDGYTAVHELRSSGYDKPIVALTAHAMKEERDRALQAGFNDYLTKPISRLQLVTTIQKFMTERPA